MESEIAVESEVHMGDQDPKLRHEFVGMMFAVAVGEVGLQVASLVRAGHISHFLPAYSHLLLATIMIATSWVGWSVSVSPARHKDVDGIFQWRFVILLLDVSLVITYFILVRTVDFGKETGPARIDPSSTVAFWILIIFLQYLVWDVVSKVFLYTDGKEGRWLRTYGSRMLPTLVCFGIAATVWRQVQTSDLPHQVSADFALLWLVLLFRALKDLIYAVFPSDLAAPDWRGKVIPTLAWSVLCLSGITVGTLATRYSWRLPLSSYVIDQIKTPLPEEDGKCNCCKSALPTSQTMKETRP